MLLGTHRKIWVNQQNCFAVGAGRHMLTASVATSAGVVGRGPKTGHRRPAIAPFALPQRHRHPSWRCIDHEQRNMQGGENNSLPK